MIKSSIAAAYWPYEEAVVALMRVVVYLARTDSYVPGIFTIPLESGAAPVVRWPVVLLFDIDERVAIWQRRERSGPIHQT